VPTEAPKDGSIGEGSSVTLIKDDGNKVTFEIVGTYEADPLKGKISLESPMGMALVGKKKGETVTVMGNTYRVSP
jgi:transcription elongation GreA/GreB family factor